MPLEIEWASALVPPTLFLGFAPRVWMWLSLDIFRKNICAPDCVALRKSGWLERSGWKGHWTLQLVGKAWKRHASLLDAAGRRGRVLRGAGGSLGTVRKSCWPEPTTGRCSWLERKDCERPTGGNSVRFGRGHTAGSEP